MRQSRAPIAALVTAGLLVAGAAAAEEPPFQTPSTSKPAPPPPAEPPAFEEAPAERPKDPAPAAPVVGPVTGGASGDAPAAPPETASSPPPLKIRPIETSPEPEPAKAAGSRGRRAPKQVVEAPEAAPRKAATAVQARGKTAVQRGKTAAQARAKPDKRAARASSGGPAATYPGFRMLEGGGSRVFVRIHGKVGVAERKARGQLIVALDGVAAPSRTNRLPLDTSFFPTPVAQVKLVARDGGAELVIELREQPSGVRVHSQEVPDGIVVMVDFPPVEGEAGDDVSAGLRGARAPRSLGSAAQAEILRERGRA